MARLRGWGRAALRRTQIREEQMVLALGDREIPLCIRHHPRARRLTLRIDPTGAGAIVTLPSGLKSRDGIEFAERKADWLIDRLDSLPKQVPFGDGTEMPLRGIPHRIRHRPESRGPVWLENGEIHVAGRPEHLPRRVVDWLKAEARRELTARARDKAARIDRTVGRVTVRDTKSRWGSCSANGNLSFCWRLILAPENVLDYVVAHEVAHLIERNHGPRFWNLVRELTDDTGGAKVWLRRNGDSLLRYG